jgi:hypothetical protein
MKIYTCLDLLRSDFPGGAVEQLGHRDRAHNAAQGPRRPLAQWSPDTLPVVNAPVGSAQHLQPGLMRRELEAFAAPTNMGPNDMIYLTTGDVPTERPSDAFGLDPQHDHREVRPPTLRDPSARPLVGVARTPWSAASGRHPRERR